MPFVSGGHIWLLLILLVIVLIIWGPGKLPDVGAALGRGIKEFKKASTEAKDQFNTAVHEEPPPPAASEPPPVAPLTGTAAPSAPAPAPTEESKVS